MYFQKSEIEEKLMCPKCKKRFDEPKIMPCGDSICKSCLDKIVINNDLRIKCPICRVEHKIPIQGELPTQKILVDLLKLKPVQVYRGEMLEKLDSNLKSIEKRIEKFFTELSLNFQEMQIQEHCEMLRNEIISDCQIDSPNSNIEHKTKLLDEVSLYEKRCMENLRKPSSSQKNNVIKFFENSNSKLIKFIDLLKNNNGLNDKIVENILNVTIVLDNKLKNGATFFKSLLFRGKFLIYKEKNGDKRLKIDADSLYVIAPTAKELMYDEFTYIDILNIERLLQKDMNKCIISYSALCLNINNQIIKGIWLAIFSSERLVFCFSIYNEATLKHEIHLKLMNRNGELTKESFDKDSDCELILMTTNQTSVIIALKYKNDDNVAYKLNIYNLDLNLKRSRLIAYKPLLIYCTDCFIYVLSETSPFIHCHEWNLNEKYSFGQDKNEDEPFYIPNLSQIFIRDEHLYVRDHENIDIKVFDLNEGYFIKKIEINLLDCLLHIDSIGNIIVINQDSKILCLFNELAQILFEYDLTFIENITSFCITDNGYLLINDSSRKVLHII
jgi:hypothetical protein